MCCVIVRLAYMSTVGCVFYNGNAISSSDENRNGGIIKVLSVKNVGHGFKTCYRLAILKGEINWTFVDVKRLRWLCYIIRAWKFSLPRMGCV